MSTPSQRHVDLDMVLPPGKTCRDCAHFTRTCEWLISCKPTNTTCDWAPSRFHQRRVQPALEDVYP